MSKRIDRTGKRFGRWMALHHSNFSGRSSWLCRCDCGNELIVYTGSLTSGRSKSCGCLKKELGAHNKTHGMAGKRLYKIWAGMKNRVKNTGYVKFHLWGGRGIKLHPEWEDFEPFYKWAMESGYKKELTLDRINNDGNYEPSNCRWATALEQSHNSRATRLTEEIVLAIRSDDRPQRTIAKEYGIHQTHVSLLKTRKLWSHI